MGETAHSIAGALARRLDAPLLMRDAGFTPDPWQEQLLESQAVRHLLLCGRQTGKSTVTAGKAVKTAIQKPGSTVIISAPAERQSKELFRKCVLMLREISTAPQIVQESKTSLELATGSRVIAVPSTEASIRGYAADLVVVDEAAACDDELFLAVMPMLATTGGSMIALTTPRGRRGWFFEQWTEGGDLWKRTRMLSKECPRITRKFLKEQKELLGPWQFKQEYECEFVDTDDAFFSSELIEAAIDPDLEVW